MPKRLQQKIGQKCNVMPFFEFVFSTSHYGDINITVNVFSFTSFHRCFLTQNNCRNILFLSTTFCERTEIQIDTHLFYISTKGEDKSHAAKEKI